MEVKIGKYTYQKSDKKDKKLMVVVNGKKIHFGQLPYQHFKDRTGIWKKLDHGDKERQRKYLNRSKGIRNKQGDLTWKNPESANYHAVRILW